MTDLQPIAGIAAGPPAGLSVAVQAFATSAKTEPKTLERLGVAPVRRSFLNWGENRRGIFQICGGLESPGCS
jgi:hypothetical protein